VVNQTFGDRRIRVRVNVGVAYGSDTDLVRRTLERVATGHPMVLPDPAPTRTLPNPGPLRRP
jgi:potassium efflux system protein